MCSFEKLYVGKTNKNFKIKYRGHTSENTFLKTNSKSNFANHALIYISYNSSYNAEKDSMILFWKNYISIMKL